MFENLEMFLKILTFLVILERFSEIFGEFVRFQAFASDFEVFQ